MINLLEGILRRPRTVLTLMVVMIAMGTFAYITIPKEANPDIDVPVFYVSVPQQGISPSDAERLLVRPMETALRGLDGVKEVTAIASEGHAGIVLEFEADFDKDEALADVRDKVDQAKSKLPEEADEPRVFETNFSLIPTIIVTLSGDVPERALYRHARRLKDQIESVSTVLEANLSGHRQELLEVIIDSMKLESYNVSQQELVNAVTLNNQLIPAGFLESGQGRFNVKVPGLVENAKDVFSLPLKQHGDGVVTLGDVAEIRRTFKDPSRFTRVNGAPAISIEVKKRIGTNIIENNDNVRKVVEAATKDFPETIRINFLLDQSQNIKEVHTSLQSSIMTAIFLVMIVVVAALGIRSALLIGLAIPTSFMVGFLILGFLGMTINMMVLFGLVLTVGMLVDGAIVIVEYADRKVAEGMDKKEAYIRAARLMFWPIFSSTATTLAAFLPMLLWPGVAGEFMSYLPIMVIIVLTASLVTAMVFLPVTGGIFGRTSATQAEKVAAKKLAHDHHFDPKEITGLTGLYVRLLHRLAAHPIGNIVTLVVVVAIGFAVATAFISNNQGVEFFVEEEPEQVIILVSARGNLAAKEARDLVIDVEKQVLQVKGIRNAVVSAFASGAGSGPAFIGGIQDKPADVIGEISVEFTDYCCRRGWKEIEKEIRSRTASIAGIKVEPRIIEGGPPVGKDIRLQIKSSDYETTKRIVGTVRKHVEGMADVRDIEDGRPLPGIEWQVTIDREEAGRFNASIATVGTMVQLVTNGVLIGKYRPGDSEDEVDIRVRLPKDERTLDKLDELRLRTPSGMVPISNFVKRTAEPKVSSIMRRDGLYTMDVKANVAKEKGVLVDDKVKELDNWLKAQNWPDNVYFRFRGADEEQQKSAEFLQKAMFGSLFLMFIILVTQFNSFYQTILTLSTVIMSVFGVLIGMMLTGQKFSIIMTGTGVVALAGIVVNNAIVLIDTYNRMREEGIEPIEAILKTSAQRIRPILLTTITTIAGLIPMATQINFDFIERVVSMGSITAIWWIQLSTAVISGLAFSTILTLVVIPIMLVAPHVWSQAFANLWRRIVLMFTRLFGRRSKSVAPAPALADAAAGVATVAQAESQPPMIPANDPTPLPTVPSIASAKPKPKVRKPKPPGVPLQDAAE